MTYPCSKPARYSREEFAEMLHYRLSQLEGHPQAQQHYGVLLQELRRQLSCYLQGRMG